MRKNGPRSGSPTRSYSFSDNPLLKRGPYSVARIPDKDRKLGTTRCIVTATSRNHNRCKLGIVGKTAYAPTATRVKNSYRPLVRSDRIQGPYTLGPKPLPRQVRAIKTIRGLCTNEDEKDDTIIISEEDNERVATRTRKKPLHLPQTPMPLITVLAASRRRSISPTTSQPQKGTVGGPAEGNHLTKLTRKMGIESPRPQIMVDKQSDEQTGKKQSEPEAEKARKDEPIETKTDNTCEDPEIIECKCPEPKPKLVSANPCPPTIMTLCDECNKRNSVGKKIITSCEVTEAHYLSFAPPELPDLPPQDTTAPYCISHVMGISQEQHPGPLKNKYDNLQPMRQSQGAGTWNRYSYNNSYGNCPMSTFMQQQEKLPRNRNSSCVSGQQLQQQPMYQQQQQQHMYQQQQQPMYQHQQESMGQQQQQQRSMCYHQKHQQLTEHLQQQELAKQPGYQCEQPTLGLTELLAQQLQQNMEVSQNKNRSCQSSPRSHRFYCSLDNQVECSSALPDQTEATSCCDCSGCCGCSSSVTDDNSPDKWKGAAEPQGDRSVKQEDPLRCPEKCNVTFQESAFYNPQPGQTMAFTYCNTPTIESSPNNVERLAANPTSEPFFTSTQPQQFNAQIQYPSQQAQNLFQLNMHPNNPYYQHQPCCWQRYAQMRFMMPRFWPCQ